MKLPQLLFSSVTQLEQWRLTNSAVALCLALSACTSEPVDWIEVPLVDNTHIDVSPAHRADDIEILVPAGTGLEYMLDMKQAYAVSYEWRSDDLSDPEKQSSMATQ